ncbi:universal stress protein [Natronomonas sp. F2-12]|jgi:nucleotide-binding universal stress UspA family protein|uniref:Universal stress protein n=1 Tax=Natronomonas aquatica TaxID=2841590 RepID=A0A9R1D760_9EURY|nr:universal stress protein [Natronomonas aquatica]MCQ4334147.1 universal stress protein [Natronomonas aquatica]
MRVLVPVDGSAPAEAAFDRTLKLFDDAEIVALYVMDPVDGSTAWGPGIGDEWLSAAEERAGSVLEATAEAAEAAGRDVRTESTIGRPAQEIVEYAQEHDIDHVVIGSHGRDGLSRVLLGSVAETVVRRAPVPVTVARRTEPE